MIRVHIHRRGSPDASIASKVLGFVLVTVGLICVVLLILGLWILLAIAVTAMAVVLLVRVMLPWGHARERMAEGHAITEGRAATLRDLDDVGGKESLSSPFLDSKP